MKYLLLAGLLLAGCGGAYTFTGDPTKPISVNVSGAITLVTH
jgi:hypothetical protein